MAITFNDSASPRAKRELLVTAVNVATSGTDDWAVIGAGIEDSAIEFNADVQTVTDILGKTETRVNKIEPQQSFDPHTIKTGSKLSVKLLDIMSRNALSELSGFDVLVIHAYIGSSGALYAEKHKNCTIVPTSIGGSSDVDMPIDVYFSNDKVIGTASNYKGSGITFTPAAA
jgi:hypothetical protein